MIKADRTAFKDFLNRRATRRGGWERSDQTARRAFISLYRAADAHVFHVALMRSTHDRIRRGM